MHCMSQAVLSTGVWSVICVGMRCVRSEICEGVRCDLHDIESNGKVLATN